MEIGRNNPVYSIEWDDFVGKSKNGTFLFMRHYMDYHADRFRDCSLLVFCNRKLTALLPGNLSGSCFYSHQGLTYGGMLLSPSITLQQVENVFRAALDYLHTKCRVQSIVYRAIPHIYHRYPAEEDLYALTRLGATLVARSISSVIPLDDRLPFRTLRRRQLKKALASSLTIAEDEDFASFWPNDTVSLPYIRWRRLPACTATSPARSPSSVYATEPKRWVDALCMRLTR